VETSVVTGVVSVVLPVDYGAWNDLLVSELFPAGRVGAPVYLSVHAGLLDEWGARYSRGGHEDFLAAVLALSPPEQLFLRLDALSHRWQEEGCVGTPPFVGGLAFAVLAAGEMATDDQATQANYYVPLNNMLGLASRERPEGFERTLEMWQTLRAWLRSERRGELVLRGLEGARPYVDPVKSQCLVRSCDIDDLVPVFAGAQVAAGITVEPEDLVASLRVWLAGFGARSRLAALLGRDPDEAALLRAAEALCDAVENHSASAPQSAPEKRDQDSEVALLAIRPNPYPNLMWRRAQWLVRYPAPPEADEPEGLLQVGERVVIAQLDVRDPPSYDAAITSREAVQLLRREMRVLNEDGDDVAVRLPVPAWFEDGSTRGRPGSWDLVRAPAAHVDHAVVMLDDRALHELRAVAREEPVFLTGSGDVWPGPGAYAACGVTPRPGAALPGGVTVQARSALLRLHGGLSIRRRVYLRGALPCLAVSPAATVEIAPEDLGAATSTISAAEIGSLDLREGPYALRSENASVRIYVVEPRWRECGTPKEASIDHEMRSAIVGGALRGALGPADNQSHLSYFRAGTHFRLLVDGKVIKGIAPLGDGIHEVRTAVRPRLATVVKSLVPCAAPPLADCFGERDESQAAVDLDQKRAAMDRLLEYVSARGFGTLDSVRPYCSALVGGTASWHSVLSALEDLGHLDVSWEARTWAAAPPVLAPRATGDGFATLSGARARETIPSLIEAGLPTLSDERSSNLGRALMPTLALVALETADRHRDVLGQMGVRLLSQSPALTIAAQVFSVVEGSWWRGPEFTPSSRVRTTLERWLPHDLRWTSPGRTGELDATGLYRWREHGMVVHYLMTESFRGRVRDPAAAKWFLAPRDRSYLSYERDNRLLAVPAAIGLPRIWRRVCGLASGIVPRRVGRVLKYDDVPLDLARAVAVRLNQSRAEGLS
jgi:hypothetical protein